MRERKRLKIMLIFMVAGALCPARGAVRVTLGGSAAFPLGDFGNRGVPYSGADEGFAGVGFAPHGQVVVELGVPVAGIALDGSLLLNSVETDDIEDAYREEYGLPESFAVDADVDFWWMTIPFLVGPTVRIEPSSLIGLYGTGLLGFALVSRPDVTVTGSDLTAEFEYDMGVGFACAAEAGITIAGLKLGSRLLFVPEVDIETDRRRSLQGLGSYNDSFQREMTVTVLEVLMGWEF